MKLNRKLSEALGKVIAAQTAGLLQLKIHRNLCQTWGYVRLTQDLRSEEERHSARLDAVMCKAVSLSYAVALDGDTLPQLKVGQTVEEVLENDKQLAEALLEPIIALHEAFAGDLRSQALAQGLAVETGDRVSHLECQLELMRQLGTENYLAARCV